MARDAVGDRRARQGLRRRKEMALGHAGFDTARWLIYAFALGAAGVIGAGIYSMVVRQRNRRIRPEDGP